MKTVRIGRVFLVLILLVTVVVADPPARLAAAQTGRGSTGSTKADSTAAEKNAAAKALAAKVGHSTSAGHPGSAKLPAKLKPDDLIKGQKLSAPGPQPARMVASDTVPPMKHKLIVGRVAPVAVPSLTTSASDTVENTDGSYTTTVGGPDRNFKDPSGTWRRTDNTLVAESKGKLRNKAGSTLLSVPSRVSNGEVESLDLPGGEHVGFRLNGQEPVVAQVDGAQATYQSILPHTDLQVTAAGRTMKEVIVLHDASIPHTYTFPLNLVGLTASVGSDGEVQYRDKSGFEVAVTPRGWMDDSSKNGFHGDPATSSGVKYELTKVDGATALVVHLDDAWLNDPKRVYPVRVDPSTVVVNPNSDDTDTDSCHPSWRHYAAPDLRLGGRDCDVAMDIKYDLSAFSHGHILGAQLNSFNSYSYSCSPRPVNVYRITQGWSGTTLGPPGPAYDPSPVATGSFAHGYNSACPGAWANWDITGLVQKWVDGTVPNYGVTLRSQVGQGNDSYTWKRFKSSESNGQTLEVNWSRYRAQYSNAQWNTPPTANRHGALGITVKNLGPLTWDNTGAHPIDISYHVYNSDLSLRVQQGIRTSLPNSLTTNQSVHLQMDVEPLPPGTYYIAIDMVQEGDTWFSASSSPAGVIQITVPDYKPVILTVQPQGTVPTVTPALSVNATDPDQYPWNGLEYRFQVCSIEVPSCFDSGWVSSSTWRVPVGEMFWDYQYYYGVTVREAGAQSMTADIGGIPFKAKVTQPVLARHFGSDPYGGSNDGVNPSIGNFTESATDAHVNNAGLGLDITRSYNSLDSRVGMFGRGWHTAFDTSISLDSVSKKATVTFGDGHQVDFGENPDLSYSAPDNYQTKLYRADGGFTLERKYKSVWKFDGDGRLLSLSDAQGHSLALTYSGAKPIQVQSDVSERTLTLDWSSGDTPKVTVVHVGAGTAQAETWSYSYSGDRLAKVCSPLSTSSCATYSYGTVGGEKDKLTEVHLPSGKLAVGIAYGPDGLVSYRRDGSGNGWTYSTDRADQPGLFHSIPAQELGNPTNTSALATTTIPALGVGDISSSGVTAIVADVHIGAPACGGGLSFYRSGDDPNANVQFPFAAGQNVDQLSTIPIGADGSFVLWNLSGCKAYVMIDVVGYYAAGHVAGGSTYHATDGQRIIDTRPAKQIGPYGSPFLAGISRTISTSSVPDLPDDGLTALVVDLTAISPSSPGGFSAHATGSTASSVSLSDTRTGQIRDNLMIVPVDSSGSFDLSLSSGTADATVDVVGWYGDATKVAGGAVFHAINPTSVLDSRPNTQVGPFNGAWPHTTAGHQLFLAGDTAVTEFGTSNNPAIPVEGTVGIAGSIEAFSPDNSGTIVEWHGDDAAAVPVLSTLRATTGVDRGNGLISGLGPNGLLDIYNRNIGASIMIVATGYFTTATAKVTVEDPNSDSTSFDFDLLGRLVTHTDELGKTQQFAYEGQGCSPGGQLCMVIDENHNATSYTYNSDGLEETVTSPGGRTVSTAYTQGGEPAVGGGNLSPGLKRTTTSPNGNATTYGYTSDGSIASETSPSGRTVSTTYTSGAENAIGGGTMPAGLQRTVTNPNGKATTYAYDHHGDLSEVTGPTGLVTNYQYDQLGQLTSKTVVSDSFPAGVATNYDYDAIGDLTDETGPAVTNPATHAEHQERTTTVYDADGLVHLIEVSDAAGSDATRTTTYTYDSTDRLISVATPDGGGTNTTYDSSGNISDVDDGSATLHYDYTARGQVADVVLMNFVDDPIGHSAPRNILEHSYAYDPVGNQTSDISANGANTTTAWSLDNLATSQTMLNYQDPSGTTRNLNLVSVSYDPDGNIVDSQMAGGIKKTHFTYDTDGRPTDATLTGNNSGYTRTENYSYDGNGNVTSASVTANGRTDTTTSTYGPGNEPLSISVPNGATSLTTLRAYDQRGLLTSVTSPGGHISTFAYDQLGRATATTGPQVQATTNGNAPVDAHPTVKFGYDTFGELTQQTDPDGNTTKKTYDAAGRVLTTTAPTYSPPLGNPTPITPTVTNTYDNQGQLTAVTNPLGKKSNFVHDKLDRLVQVIEPAVGTNARATTQTKYDDLGSVTSTTDEIGAVNTTSYDYLGRVSSTTQFERDPAVSFTTHFGYDDAGRLLSVTDPTAVTRTATFDPAGEQLTDSDGIGTTNYSYDNQGRTTSIVDPLGRTTNATYDPVGQLSAVTHKDAQGNQIDQTTAAYDDDGNVTSVTDPNNHPTTYTYDALGKLLTRTAPTTSGHSITESWGYDTSGHPTIHTDGRGNDTVSNYNTLGLPESLIEPATPSTPNASDRTWTNVYNAGGLPTGTQEPGAPVIFRAFDELGRPSGELGINAEAPNSARVFGYNARGDLTSASSPSGNITMGYNDRGELRSVAGGSSDASYSYDAAGRIASQTTNAGTANLTYDSRGLLATEHEPLTNTTLSFGYDPAGQETGVTYGNSGATRAITYDGNGRPTSDKLSNTTGTMWSADYGYDSNGNLTSKNIGPSAAAGAGNNTYTYDDANRLTSWTDPANKATAYAWDDASNRTQAGATTATYDARNQVTKSTTGPSTTDYDWTPRGTRLSATTGSTVTNSASDAFGKPVTQGTTNYAYDALGRIAKRNNTVMTYPGVSTTPSDDGTTTSSFDPTTQLAGNDTPTLPQQVTTPGVAMTGVTRAAPGRIAETQLASTTSGASTLTLTDAHTDTVASFSTTGQLAASNAYDPFGQPIAHQGINQSVGFQSNWVDPTTGLVAMGARWYDPATGSFTSRDNTADTNVANPYSYTSANPLTSTDPSGAAASGNPNLCLVSYSRSSSNHCPQQAPPATAVPGTPRCCVYVGGGAAGAGLFGRSASSSGGGGGSSRGVGRSGGGGAMSGGGGGTGYAAPKAWPGQFNAGPGAPAALSTLGQEISSGHYQPRLSLNPTISVRAGTSPYAELQTSPLVLPNGAQSSSGAGGQAPTVPCQALGCTSNAAPAVMQLNAMLGGSSAQFAQIGCGPCSWAKDKAASGGKAVVHGGRWVANKGAKLAIEMQTGGLADCQRLIKHAPARCPRGSKTIEEEHPIADQVLIPIATVAILVLVAAYIYPILFADCFGNGCNEDEEAVEKIVNADESIAEALRGGAGPVRVGQAGEDAVRSVYDIGPKATREINGRTRIFDGLNRTTVSEVKNVAKQAFTLQLQDDVDYAKAKDLVFDLYVRPDTILTGPLKKAILQGDIVLKDIP